MHLFERHLAVMPVPLVMRLDWADPLAWADLLLNPRRLRGSDFLMRWSQGVWSEKRLIEAVEETGKYFALAYGPSGVAPDQDPRAFELYFERLEAAGLGGVKRPDLLVFRQSDRAAVDDAVRQAGGASELPFVPEAQLQEILRRAIIAVECENSLWKASRMPKFGAQLTPQRRLGGRAGLPKSAVAPTIILKREDLAPLTEWQRASGIPIHIWHVFYDLAYGIALDRASKLIADGDIAPTEQIFQAPGGATTRKAIYKVYYQHAYPVGGALSEPALVADSIEDKNGHILPYVRFQGGRLAMDPLAVKVIDQASSTRGK